MLVQHKIILRVDFYSYIDLKVTQFQEQGIWPLLGRIMDEGDVN